jgi:ribosomal protein S18 acetylase RimI-like enzyme
VSAPTLSLPADWSPRPYRAGDEKQILNALLGAFGKWPTVDIDVPPIEHLRWKLHSHVLAPEHHMIAEVDGVVASARSLLVQPVRFQGEPRLAFQPVDLAVAPQFQGLGLTRRLRLIELRKMRETYPSTFAIKLYIRSWHPAARRLREQIVAHGYAFGNRMIALERPNDTLPAQDPATAHTLRNVTAFDDRIDAFWREASRPFAFAVDRSREYLTWRYDRRAGAFTITLAEDGEKLLGYAVTRTSRNVGYIADLIALPDRLDVARSLLSNALSSFARTDGHTVECWLPTRHAYQPLLRELGFTRSERKLRFRYTPVGLTKEQLAPLRKSDTPVHITAGDTDLV